MTLLKPEFCYIRVRYIRVPLYLDLFTVDNLVNPFAAIYSGMRCAGLFMGKSKKQRIFIYNHFTCSFFQRKRNGVQKTVIYACLMH